MVKLVRSRRRGGASAQGWLAIVMLAFVAVNVYFLFKRSGGGSSSTGEGRHRSVLCATPLLALCLPICVRMMPEDVAALRS